MTSLSVDACYLCGVMRAETQAMQVWRQIKSAQSMFGDHLLAVISGGVATQIRSSRSLRRCSPLEVPPEASIFNLNATLAMVNSISEHHCLYVDASLEDVAGSLMHRASCKQ